VLFVFKGEFWFMALTIKMPSGVDYRNKSGSFIARARGQRLTSRSLISAVLLLTLSSHATLALDGTRAPADQKPEIPLFTNPQDAFREGLEEYQSGAFENSVAALKYAASQGYPLAQWKLGRMYADGDGVQHDDAQAYNYFLGIVNNFREDDQDDVGRRELSFISNAFVAVGIYALNGISKAKIEPDPGRAFSMFQFAAMNFGDPNAQYNLARMYIDGIGCEKDPRQAARWLNLAAEKHHSAAQALLGHMLFFGQGVQQQRGRGLMWLTLARDTATLPKDKWITDLYTNAFKIASDDDRQVAMVYIMQVQPKEP
jgi:uncharacterized protein